MEIILDWILRLVLIGIGVWAATRVVAWIGRAQRERRERWAVRLGLVLVVAGAVYAVGHAWLLLNRDSIQEGRMWYARWGDPRLAEERRAEVRGWILDCTGREENALAGYALRDGRVERSYPLGEAGANLIGGGEDAGARDFTVERLFAGRLREPATIWERGRLHPVGRDMRLTVCADGVREAHRLLTGTGRHGAVVVQEVTTGAVLAYAATGGPEDPPLGMRQYAPPGSVFKLALAGVWWDNDLGDPPIPCPPSIEVGPGAHIGNYGGIGLGTLRGPLDMLVFSCNTGAVWMAREARARLGEEAFVEAYRRYGFLPYPEAPPVGIDTAFWSTTSEPWRRRMSPAPARIRIGPGSSALEWAQLSIGQGPVDVTPMHISRFVQAIGNGGVMRDPLLEQEALENRAPGSRVMRHETAVRLAESMRDVVARGTARSVAGRPAGEWSLGGKTGTAQIQGAADDGWFAGLVFDDQGVARYTVVAYLRGGGPGGAAPAAIAAGMAEWLANREEP